MSDGPSDFDAERAAWARLALSHRAAAAAWVTQARDVVAAFFTARDAGHVETAILEIAGTLRVSQRTAERILAAAMGVIGHPRVADAVETGQLGQYHAFALVNALVGLSDQVAEAVITEVLATVDEHPPAAVGRLATRAALRLDPESAARRRREAETTRSFGISPANDGMAWVRLLVRAEAALKIAQRADLATRTRDDTGRTHDQRRADWAVDQLLGDTPTELVADPVPTHRRRARPTQILVHVPVAVALGLAEAPGELAGYGPIDAEHTRTLFTDAELRKVCVDAISGDVVHVEDTVTRPVPDPTRVQALGGGTQAYHQAHTEAIRAALLTMITTPSAAPTTPEPGYRPSASLSRAVKIRSVHCDMVGCTQPAHRCDDEHTIPYPQGPTTLANLKSRSRRCHRAKQNGWTPTPTPDGGTQWHSPSGRTYHVHSPHAPPPPIPQNATRPPPRAAQPPTPPPPPWASNDTWRLEELTKQLTPAPPPNPGPPPPF